MSPGIFRSLLSVHAWSLLLLVWGCRAPRTHGPSEPTEPTRSQAERAWDQPAADSTPRARAKEDPLCRGVGPGVTRGKLPTRGLDEVSGLVASRVQPNLLWVHNDSGDGARIYAIETSGELRMQVDLRGADAVDYEDIAWGPGPIEGQNYLYVADIGDNLARRQWVQIYRLPEPDVASRSERKITVPVERIDLAYEGGPRDAEALIIDPQSGDLYIVSKGAFFARKDAPMPVFRVPRGELERRKVTAKLVATVALGPVTAADVLPDGSGVAVRNYKRLRFWPRASGQPLFAALSGDFCEWPLADARKQGEAFGFRADGRGYFTISEGSQQPIYEFSFE